MISKRYKDEITPGLAEIPARLALTQFVGESNNFGLVLKGEFFLPESWAGGETFWLNQKGKILINCPLPEALVKLSFRIIPAKRPKYPALRLVFSQGQNTLREDVISKAEDYHLYISLLEGINPIDCRVVGEVLSPSVACGEPDSRKLSFAFQNLLKVELLA